MLIESKSRTVKTDFIAFRGSIITMSRSVISGDDLVEQLLATDTIIVRDGDGQTALLWAAKKGQLRLVERLLDRGRADPNITNIYNQTPLLWAANNGHNALTLQPGHRQNRSEF
jgi:ankyrin repeat protein